MEKTVVKKSINKKTKTTTAGEVSVTKPKVASTKKKENTVAKKETAVSSKAKSARKPKNVKDSSANVVKKIKKKADVKVPSTIPKNRCISATEINARSEAKLRAEIKTEIEAEIEEEIEAEKKESFWNGFWVGAGTIVGIIFLLIAVFCLLLARAIGLI